MTWALQWQPQGIIGWRDIQTGPPNHVCIDPKIRLNRIENIFNHHSLHLPMP
jgi:hypothetical protein